MATTPEYTIVKARSRHFVSPFFLETVLYNYTGNSLLATDTLRQPRQHSQHSQHSQRITFNYRLSKAKAQLWPQS